ncbi:polysaccharide biosynthesis tyrosine autokinase [Spirosoma sp. RP8]|uniref:non-specific protein-tyrosine kinase n=1 Tax=Spirosoma liriopis TaxID=2937440 RepID=A0ABT0HRT3_9BACT|nr:polysaccharide biosynthesis tyrosine autokinase [Spirosoma liriopis]MCK8494876.1 polysaccharide biosynthesis tyrosine autokinase [Spirosoma liriopis]
MSQDDQAFIDDQEDTSILDYAFKYLRYWLLILVSMVISLGCAYFYLKFYTPVYEVNATLLIKDTKKVNSDVLEKLDMESSSKLVENEIEKLKSRVLLGNVVDSLKLGVTYWREENLRDSELFNESPVQISDTRLTDFAYSNPLFIQLDSANEYTLFDRERNNLGRFAFNQLVETKYGKFKINNHDSLAKAHLTSVKVVFQNRDALINNLTNQLQITLLNYESSLISLSLETTIPAKGKAILSRLVDVYTVSSLDDKKREAASTLSFIEERLKLVTAELGGVEHNIEHYRRVKGITDLSSETNLLLNKVKENDSKLNELEIQVKVLDGVEGYLNSAQVGVVAPGIMMGFNDPVLKSYIEQLAHLEAERSKLAQTVQPGNPYLESINNQMHTVKQAVRDNLSNRKRGLNANRRGLINLNNRLEGAIAAIPQKERELVGIKRQANIKENLYLLLLKTREQTAIHYASAVADSRIVDAPYSTGEPIKPKTKNIYLMALLLGFAIPIAFITLNDLLTSNIQSKQEVERKTGLPIFAEISSKPKGKGKEVVDVHARSLMSEQIRMLRSNLHYLFLNTKKESGRTVLITSSTCGEGKSFITLNLAASLAMLNKKVVILGLDLRKPKPDDYPGTTNTAGISSYLVGELEIEDIILDTNTPNLYIIPSGYTPTNPSELIANGRVDELIHSLQRSFDYILIDTAPVGLVTDATLLAPFVDICFYIVRHKVTPRFYLKNLNDLHKQGIFKSLHVVFNAVDYKHSSDHRYGYGHGSNGYYKEDTRSKGWLRRLPARL